MDAVAYKNGAKNQWRRTIWNLIRLHAKPGPILYLPGSTDLDRVEAIRKGFKPANLIAVERDREVVKHLRAMGTTTIHGDLDDVLRSWPTGVPLAALIADLQCGLDVWVLEMISDVCRSAAFKGTVLTVNLQRGRDSLGREFSPREVRGTAGGSTFNMRRLDSLGAASRAGAVWTIIQSALFDEFENVSCWAEEDVNSAVHGSADQKRLMTLWGNILRFYETAYFLAPYRSTPRSPLFDSIVVPFNRHSRWVDPAPRKAGTLGPQVTAALAIRTRKLRGELNGGYYKQPTRLA